MKISRFFGVNSREVMRQVRQVLGPDALIVSNRSVDGGVEVLATVDGAVAGCVAQQEGEKLLSRAPFVDIVLGPDNVHLSRDYEWNDVRATEGVDPTWDAGVIVREAPRDAPLWAFPGTDELMQSVRPKKPAAKKRA